MQAETLIAKIIQCAYDVRSQLSAGYLEIVYRNALLVELRESGLTADSEVPLSVFYKGNVVGEYRADIVVDNRVIVELKAVQKLSSIHEAQLVNYLTTTGIDDGLLINFGSDKLEVKRKYRVYRPTK
ncbi:MAG: GxxExxY protein [Muribaculaceae bacterium]|nr:GxxExxY protein [Muribaculaceae bacterium]